MGIRAVGFDLDGTLYPSRSLFFSCADIGLAHGRRLSAYSAVRQELRALARDPEFRLRAPEDGTALRRLQASMLATRISIPEDSALEWLERIPYGEIAERFARVRLYPGVRDALDAIRAAGLKTALLSDLPPRRKLALLGIEDSFDVILCSEDSGLLKPDTRCFVAMREALGVSPEEIAYVGNKVKYDAAGARAAGMRSAIVSARRVRGADFSFFDWSRLLPWIRSLT